MELCGVVIIKINYLIECDKLARIIMHHYSFSGLKIVSLFILKKETERF